MTPKELLDDILGFLGFVVEIQEQQNEPSLILHESVQHFDVNTSKSLADKLFANERAGRGVRG